MKKKKLKQKNKDNIFSYKKFCNSDFINIIIKISIKLEKQYLYIKCDTYFLLITKFYFQYF